MAVPVAVPIDLDAVEANPVPVGRRVRLPGRGDIFVREVDGPPGAPTLLLVHGWIASGGLNWFQAFEPLSRHFHVVAPDLRGHGRGIRSRGRFRLADCADDLAALVVALGRAPVVAMAYSMGGPVAQLLWHRHPEVVAGMVLAATGSSFVTDGGQRDFYTSAMATVAGAARLGGTLAHLPSAGARRLVSGRRGGRPARFRDWAVGELRRHDWRMLLEAGGAIGRFDSRGWIGDVDVPTTVVITTRDVAIHPDTQLGMARAIPEASVKTMDQGHTACTRNGFGDKMLEAGLEVAARLDRPRGPREVSRCGS